LIPQVLRVSVENETLRWPTNLDHAAIVERLVRMRGEAEAAGVTEVVRRLEGIESLPAGKLGAKVIAALTWLQEKADYRPYATQLEMIAVNLKNLR
jgi:hypothetical protein